MTTAKLQSVLRNVGLSDKEASIYLVLLELKEALPSTISRKANVKRPTTYTVLERLQSLGLATHVRKGKFLYYQALHPSSLVNDRLSKYQELEKALPELTSLHQKFAVIPQMSVYEGKEGLIKIMEDTLTTSTEVLVWADVDDAVTTVLKDYYPSYIKKKVKNKVYVRGIGTYTPIALDFKKKGKEELREIYLIPKEKFPFKNEINIYDDKVAILSHEDGMGIIIQNQNIADTQRSIFEFGYEYAKMMEPKILSKKDKEYLESS